uniref:NPL domain-containing protein n=1 Tax=Schistosoma curassoni TaxID=6186 RepID=A0A183KXN0_9TREM
LPDNGQSIKCTLGKECHVYHFVVSLFNRYNHKTVGYFAAVDLSEVIQNSLIDDDHLNVINNKEMNQSLNQPNLMFLICKYAALALPIHAFTFASKPPCPSMTLESFVKGFTPSKATPSSVM